ncbi:MAG: PDZ domain-containing protein, partial [Acidobacteriota bacterium]|nr:PDZ domain-containing protein [Acidobacteriota bacterium]
AVAIFAATSGGWVFKSIKRGQLGPVHITANTPPSFFGAAEGFETTPGDDGAMITVVSPGGPADKAGLIGGDIVISFDGHSVHGADDIREKLSSTPAGKTVEVEYVRDGETKKTLLTTISKGEGDDNRDEFLSEPKGQLGISGLDRVPVPGLNIHGVQVGNVRRNNPADLAGWKDDDIVIEFDGTPIRTSGELSSRIDRATPGNTVKTIIIRNGERLEIPVKVGRE